MIKFQFKCPQCGRSVVAEESLRGNVVECPHCEKGIVVPHNRQKQEIPPPLTSPKMPITSETCDKDLNVETSNAKKIGEAICALHDSVKIIVWTICGSVKKQNCKIMRDRIKEMACAIYTRINICWKTLLDKLNTRSDFRNHLIAYGVLSGVIFILVCILIFKDTSQAAERGDANAQYNLGLRYQFGIGGTKKDYAEAVKWYLKAAKQGHAYAQCCLGVCYDNGGYGVKKNDSEAVKWYRKAAEQGNSVAQTALRELGVD